MVTYDAQATRRRLLDAAYSEFAQYGIAGARVDRIAEAADSNKAQIYHYFGGKAQLFDAVCELAMQQMEAEVPFDPYDLPGYAGRLVRLHERRPEMMRLCTWQRLERTDGDPSPAGVAYARTEIDAIVLHLATGWVSVSPEFEAAIDVPNTEERARHVEDAIRTLLGPPARA
jgi:AcrR family transcriptional regulator